MIYAVLLAGGTGTRLKSASIPKQFIKIGNESLLEMVVEKFLMAPGIDRILVVANPVWLEHTHDILKAKKFSDILICSGGHTRQESLYLGCKFLKEKFEVSPGDKVISHDVARPFITLRIIEDNIRGLETFRAVDTMIPASDTIVESQNGRCISSIPLRKHMYQGQTPQSFFLLDYIRLYEAADETYLNTLTDAAKLFVENGIEVGLVEGEIFNLKITDDFSVSVAKGLLGAGYNAAPAPGTPDKNAETATGSGTETGTGTAPDREPRHD